MSHQVDIAMLRYIIAKDMEERMKAAGHGWLYRKWTGLNFDALNKKRLVTSRDQRGDVPASGAWPDTRVFFWLLSSKEDDSGITVEKVGSAVLATVKVAAGVAAGQGAFGTTVQSVHEAHSTASRFHTGGGGVLASAALHLANKSVGKLARETDNMWCLEVDNMMMCGAAAIAGGAEDTTIYMRKWPDKNTINTFMARSYQDGLNTLAGRKYVRNLCTEEKWQYNAAKGTLKKVTDAGEMVRLARS